MLEYVSHSLEETESLAKKIATKIKSNDVVAFTGGLGVGKTTFIRSLVEALGSNSQVSSPTFSLINHYIADINIYHFDMYRIEYIDDLYSTGFFEYLDSGNILLIEWSEKIESALPPQVIKIDIQNIGETSRRFTIQSEGDDRF